MTISMKPGHTQLARIPSAAKSRASVPVNEIIAAFDTLYAASSTAGLRPAIEAVLTIDPPPPSRIKGMAARDMR